MLKHNTVFVLGAGSSCDFSYPSGSKLMALIRRECFKIERGDFQILANTGNIDQKQYGELRKLIDEVNYDSIDELLASHREHLDIGKLMIALCLLPFEQREATFKIEYRSVNWMHYLFKKMAGHDLKEFAVNEVTFITFNYDRCFDYFLKR